MSGIWWAMERRPPRARAARIGAVRSPQRDPPTASTHLTDMSQIYYSP